MARPKTSPVWKINKEDLIKLVDSSKTLGEVLAYFSMKNHGSNYMTIRRRFEQDEINYSKFKGNFGKGAFKPLIPLEEVVVEGSNFCRSHLKKRLLKAGILQNICAECNLKDEWGGKPIVMVLDHINGVNNDNRLENLRMLCPNCNSQTATFAGKKKKIFYNCKKCGKGIVKKSTYCADCNSLSREVIKWPSKEELQKLLWEKPTTLLAKEFGVSDKAIAKRLKKYGLEKPPRGYWQKKV